MPMPSVDTLKGVGPSRAHALQRMGISTCEDLITHFPFRYEDRTSCVPLARVKINSFHVVRGTIANVRGQYLSGGVPLVRVTLKDSTGTLEAVWFHQPYLVKSFAQGMQLMLYGKVTWFKNRMQMTNPSFEKEDPTAGEKAGTIVPVYSLSEGISQKMMRTWVNTAFESGLIQMQDVLPLRIKAELNLMEVREALRQIHFPDTMHKAVQAKQRLIFDEFFYMHCALTLRSACIARQKGISHQISKDMIINYGQNVPFLLTPSQKKAMQEILSDMESPFAMYRLLQGDVGSGKTVVAGCALIACAMNGYQAVCMAPTEILAKQHYQSLRPLIEAMGYSVGLLVGSMTSKEKEHMYQAFQGGTVHIVIGTHALLQKKVTFQKLGLVVIDEQHRFGVVQRDTLKRKGIHPDILIMTATPIPRSLALTVYGALDMTVIDQLPAGRKPVKTYYVPEQKRNDMYQFVRQQLNAQRQVYVVCPLIAQSASMDMQAAEEVCALLKEEILREFRVALVHGAMKQEMRDNAMSAFKERNIDVLVSTTVVEVGIDVPNATIMIIEDAQRFGLSQLHQLRGRIGRGTHESYCFLLGEFDTLEAQKRRDVFLSCRDGFRIAEEDLIQRGPGEFMGTRQCGFPECKIGDIWADRDILEQSKKKAEELCAQGSRFSIAERQKVFDEVKRRYQVQFQI